MFNTAYVSSSHPYSCSFLQIKKYVIRYIMFTVHGLFFVLILNSIFVCINNYLILLALWTELCNRLLYIYLWLYSPCGPWPHFLFLNLRTVGKTPWTGISPSQGRYLHTELLKHRIIAHIHPCLEWNSNPRAQSSRGERRFMP
jgi:hypothetical protein